MLSLLLDEHISPVVARQLRAKCLELQQPEITILSLQEWQDGTSLGWPDEMILQVARDQHLTLVTYDQRTILPLLKMWGEAGASHGGVIFIDEKTIAPNDFGGLVRALLFLLQALGEMEWSNQVLYLVPAAHAG